MITQEKILKMKTPAFFTVIIRSLTILEGFALAVDKNFRLVRGAYPYVLAQLLSSPLNGSVPSSLTKLLTRLLTVDGQGALLATILNLLLDAYVTLPLIYSLFV
jgi:predicted unusual protein kinase regulating ubiquinone biosynthesis (AarF/ABC1/UbiB family)